MKLFKAMFLSISGKSGIIQSPIASRRLGAAGFTLVEMLLVAAISSVVILTASAISITGTKSSIKAYVVQGLRDKYARLTYFIEGEVEESDSLSVVDNGNCVAPISLAGLVAQPVFLFSFRHRYVDNSSVFTCFYNVPLVDNPDNNPNNWALYRRGPAFGNITGVIGGVNGSDANGATLNPGLYVVAPYVRVTTPMLNANCGSTGFPNVAAVVKFSCDGRTLTYSMSIGTGSSGRDTIWNSTYPSPVRVITLRTRNR
ncbi:MAG: prepilin-type N-terminal cleavage/methylation domain-containing protein [Synechococcales cyanobacterium SupBloom_Metag_052]|nr:prepilin-type N-terminal cleavage/methylation domain-containing protein [Synechococcales cyanobacterium SupBloom_Metag_052]